VSIRWNLRFGNERLWRCIPLPAKEGRNAELLGMLAPQFEEELKQENGDEDLVGRVRIAVRQKLTGRRPTIEGIADALHVSSRTLQGRLRDAGSSTPR
jgi:AraC-like DNA-binding protein